jgi:menaquinone-9 beta-reductase
VANAHAGAVRQPARPSTFTCDVLVVGGGPSGAASAYWLAKAGLDVLVVEKKHHPREKTCGDLLSSRAVRQLYDMGLHDDLTDRHRFDRLRVLGFGREVVLSWPKHPEYPSYGYVITRSELDALVSRRAETSGAVFWQGAEAIEPLGELSGQGGPACGARVLDHAHGRTTDVRASYVIVADGANSRFGRALGAERDRSRPFGMALRAYYFSPRHAEPTIEFHLDLRDAEGSVLPGYGWIFPTGDGRVNVGVGLVSSYHSWKTVNTSNLLAAFVAHAPRSWCLEPKTMCAAATGGRLPMGLSVGPRVGPDYLLVGDAGGSVNPFNGEGIAYGYETGRLAATHVIAASATHEPSVLKQYESALEDHYGTYFKVGSNFTQLVGRPQFMERLFATAMHSRSAMGWLVRIMSNLMRPDETGTAELAYRAAAAIAARVS